jgi:hypothetical protein
MEKGGCMKKFLLVFSLLTFVSVSVAFTFTDDPKKSDSACPYIQKMESSGCPYMNNKIQQEGSTENKSECPYFKGNSEKSKEIKNRIDKKLENIKT